MRDMGLKDELKEEVEDLDKRMELERAKRDGSRLGLIDLLTEKIVSRKLLVWVLATVLLFNGSITSEEWTQISIGYVGIEGFADMIVKYKMAGK